MAILNKVAAVACGNTTFSRDDLPIEKILLQATKDLFDNNQNVSQKDIEAVLVSTNDNSKYLAAILSELSGIQPKVSHTIESLCNSGTNAIVSGFSHIAAGICDVVLIVGADRFDNPGQILEWDKSRGEFKHPVYWASIFTNSYKREYGISDEDLAIVSAKNHKNAQLNPYAYSKKSFTVQEILNSKKITDDLKILDCSYPCTGASAILLANEERASEFTDRPVWISGIGQKTLSAGFTKSPDFSSMESIKTAAKTAYAMAKTNPTEIDLVELHDAFSVCEPMALEALKLTEKGAGAKYCRNLFETDDNTVNPRGGLLGSGHPLGATGVAQTNEVVRQLQGKADRRQIKNPSRGLVQNMSAAATSSTVLILES